MYEYLLQENLRLLGMVETLELVGKGDVVEKEDVVGNMN